MWLKSPHGQTKEETDMNVRESLASRTGIAGELLFFFWQHKWWWLTPMIFVLILFSGLVIFAQSSAIAPFIYTLF
jgi:hypothetical protein